MKPHKHAELIKKWADGAQIQFYCPTLDRWEDVVSNRPHWDKDESYRIKPDEPKPPVVRWLWADRFRVITSRLYSEEEIEVIDIKGVCKRLEWSRTEFPE